MNAVWDVLTFYGAIWAVVTVVAVVLLFWLGSRGEPSLEDEPEGELIRVNFSGRGRAA